MAKFDGLQKQVFSTIQSYFGDALIWWPSNGDPSQSCLVLYNSPESKVTIGVTEKYDYSHYNHSFEYYIDQLTDLKKVVDEGKTEYVTIGGTITLCVREITAKKDGKTLIAYCDDV